MVYSFVIPIYNEQESLPELYRRMTGILGKLDGDAEVLMVDDGSKDGSYALLVEIASKDPRFKIIRLSRNFGHQVAISAGMDFSTGQATIIMDADLQDPPEVVLQMAGKWREGFEIVYAIRERRKGENWFKLITARIFYRLLSKFTEIEMPEDVGDFRLVDRKALNAFLALRESSRYVRGMFSWIGFKQTGVHYVRDERFSGTTKYPFRKMIRLAMDGILGFSNAPLRTVLNLGFFISGMAFLMGIVFIVLKLMGAYTVQGWTSLAVLVAFLSGTQLVVTGLLGQYIGRIYEEVKHRPLYFIHSLHNLPQQHAAQHKTIAHSFEKH